MQDHLESEHDLEPKETENKRTLRSILVFLLGATAFLWGEFKFIQTVVELQVKPCQEHVAEQDKRIEKLEYSNGELLVVLAAQQVAMENMQKQVKSDEEAIDHLLKALKSFDKGMDKLMEWIKELNKDVEALKKPLKEPKENK